MFQTSDPLFDRTWVFAAPSYDSLVTIELVDASTDRPVGRFETSVFAILQVSSRGLRCRTWSALVQCISRSRGERLLRSMRRLVFRIRVICAIPPVSVAVSSRRWLLLLYAFLWKPGFERGRQVPLMCLVQLSSLSPICHKERLERDADSTSDHLRAFVVSPWVTGPCGTPTGIWY